MGQEQVLTDQAENLRSIMRKAESGSSGGGSCRSIAVTSGKGGVGKTCVSISLAAGLAFSQKKVLIIDGDLGLANVHIMLGISPEFNISHYINNECTKKDIITRISENLFILPGASGIPSLSDIKKHDLERLVQLFAGLEKEFDYLIIDGGAGVNESVMRLNAAADKVLIVMTPDPASLTDAYAVTKLLFMKGISDISVAVNMADSDKGAENTVAKLSMLTEKFLKFKPEYFTSFPFDRGVRRVIRNQDLPLDSVKSGFAKSIDSGVKKLLGERPEQNKGSFFMRLIKGKG